MCAGQSVTTGFLETLAKGLGASMAAEVLPEHVLARTPELIAWWSRAQSRLMFFGDGDPKTRNLNGKMYPHPALVFMIHGRELFVRALAENRRPKSDTRLRNAPYWNTDTQGRVCLGSMRVPEEVSASCPARLGRSVFRQRIHAPKWCGAIDNSFRRLRWALVVSGWTKASVSCEVSGRQ